MARSLNTRMSQGAAIATAHTYFPSFLHSRAQAMKLDEWHRGEQNTEDSLYIPAGAEAEYTDLAEVSRNSWASLIVTSVVQNAELTGMRMPGTEKNLKGWLSWQRNRMDAKQPALYTASCAHGAAYVWASDSTDPLTGQPMSKYTMSSAMEMSAWYSPDDDEWAELAILGRLRYSKEGTPVGYFVRMWDATHVYYLSCEGEGTTPSQWTYISHEPHGAQVVPVVRYAPNLDIDGRTNSDLQGFIPLLKRIDQDTFDRLIVQRFGAWKIRYIAGMVQPGGSASDVAARKIQLRIESLLIAEDKDTKFGTLDATDLAGFIASRDSDLRDLSALSQTPPHHMLGLSSNLQAESLAAAESGLQRKSRGHRGSWGESHEQLFRLDAHMRQDEEEAGAHEMQAIWRDTESRSFEQAAMALGMLATNLKVPIEMLWERIPGWTDNDVERAKKLVENGSMDQLLADMEALVGNKDQQQPNVPAS